MATRYAVAAILQPFNKTPSRNPGGTIPAPLARSGPGAIGGAGPRPAPAGRAAGAGQSRAGKPLVRESAQRFPACALRAEEP